MKKRKTEDLDVAKWSGGTTTEFLIFPETASYADRDFLFRISSAVIEDEHSVFTGLPDYERILMVLEGAVELMHNDDGNTSAVFLDESDQTRFSGKWQTESRGRITDFNVIFRPFLDAELKVLENSSVVIEERKFVFVWCREGEVKVSGEIVHEGAFVYGFPEAGTAVECWGKAILVTICGTLP